MDARPDTGEQVVQRSATTVEPWATGVRSRTTGGVHSKSSSRSHAQLNRASASEGHPAERPHA
eukprot:1779988-Lingulodinium_polyedra.AAC.1